MLIDKKNLPLVDMEFMNETHFEDVDLINSLYSLIEKYELEANSSNFNNLKLGYLNWVEHTEKHFETEEIQMQEKGFFAYPFHKGEHDSNLLEIKAVWSSFEATKDIKELKNYIKYDLTSWLINHIQTMDTVTARFFKTGVSPCGMM